MEEIGYRTDVFKLDGIAGSQRDYIHWLLAASTGGKVEPIDIFTAEAINMLATKLRTPLQVQFDAKAAEIRAMFSNQLEPKRTAEIRERMLAAGLPI
ncbi:hypothetical protein [Herminiimonas contaminans]|uniref:hypothetical protein n=1 Tax=Herminiimonas contaminans TaxID=1111140 RepID=UPI001E43D68B|nr:hypothetical protein [Herminiimonas contaminans]